MQGRVIQKNNGKSKTPVRGVLIWLPSSTINRLVVSRIEPKLISILENREYMAELRGKLAEIRAFYRILALSAAK